MITTDVDELFGLIILISSCFRFFPITNDSLLNFHMIYLNKNTVKSDFKLLLLNSFASAEEQTRRKF